MKCNFLREHVILERKEKWLQPPFLLELHKQVAGVEEICEYYWNKVQESLKDGECTLALNNIPWIKNGVLRVQDIPDQGVEDSGFVRTDVDVENGKLTNVKIFVGCWISGKNGKVLFYKNFAHELTHSYDYLKRRLESRETEAPGYDSIIRHYLGARNNIEVDLAEILYKTSRVERQAIFGSIRAEFESEHKAGSSYWNNIKSCQNSIENLSYIKDLEDCTKTINNFRVVLQLPDGARMKLMQAVVDTYEDIFQEKVPMHGKSNKDSLELKFKRVIRKLENKVEITRDRYIKVAAKVCADLRPVSESIYYPGKRLIIHKLNSIKL